MPYSYADKFVFSTCSENIESDRGIGNEIRERRKTDRIIWARIERLVVLLIALIKTNRGETIR